MYVVKTNSPPSGKHKFTPADLEEAVTAAKAAALITMVCSIIPATEYAHYFAFMVYTKFNHVMRQILGIAVYYWWLEMVGAVLGLGSVT